MERSLQFVTMRQCRCSHCLHFRQVNTSEVANLSLCFGTAISSDLTSDQKQALQVLLFKHQRSFDGFSSDLGNTSAAEYRIDTDASSIVRRRSYRVSPSERRIIQDNVDDMLKCNIIRPSSSPWPSSVVLVQKRTYAFASTIGRLTK